MRCDACDRRDKREAIQRLSSERDLGPAKRPSNECTLFDEKKRSPSALREGESMNLTSIPQIYRNASRWREIFAILSKHGLADWLERFDLSVAKTLLSKSVPPDHRGLGREARVRMALEELGPTFIKFGQVLATRPDQVGVEMAEELSKLQTAAPADPPETIRAIVEEELGCKIEDRFADFESEPVASASIGQVHRARLHDGADVAVKVRHPAVPETIRVDAEILAGLAELAERLPELRPYRPVATVQEFERTLRREIDLSDELRRIQQFREVFEDDPRIRIPRPYPEASASAVITLEWLEGQKLSGPPLADDPPGVLERIARNGAEVYLEMIFEHGLYHADPHPGNLLVLEGGVIGLLDFGMVGRISESLREQLEDVLIAIAAGDPNQLASALLRIGTPPLALDDHAFAVDVEDFVDHFGHQEVSKFDMAGALTELFRLVRRHGVVLPAQLGMLLKLLVLLEGTARKLQPDFSLLEVLAPMQKRITLRRLSPARQAKKVQRIYSDVEQLAEELPRKIRDLLNQLQTGQARARLDHRGLEPAVNRLVLGLLTSSLIVGGSLMLSREVLPVYGVSAPGLLAFALSGLLGLRLARAISKSGWLDSH